MPALQIQKPAPSGPTPAPGRAPVSVTIHPSALFSVLDHFLRRSSTQDRVIGTLLGVRTESPSGGGVTIDVRSSFAVLHSETEEQVAVDMDYHHTMYDLARKAHPKEVIVGWYSTGSKLDTYAALIQNFYSQETAPHQAIHIALDTGLQQGTSAGFNAYISSPVGVHPKPENAVFIPIPCELRFNETERTGISLLSHTPSSPSSPLDALSAQLNALNESLDRALAYVRSVLDGSKQGDAAVGRYLLDTLDSMPTNIDTSAGLQDTLMMSYLANLVRAQAEVAARLALTTAP